MKKSLFYCSNMWNEIIKLVKIHNIDKIFIENYIFIAK